MSLLTLPAFLTRRREDTTMPEITTPEASTGTVMRFLTQGGAIVELRLHAWTETYYRDGKVYERVDKSGFEWSCGGCDMTGAQQHLRLGGHGYEEREPRDSRRDANDHASNCWAMRKREA